MRKILRAIWVTQHSVSLQDASYWLPIPTLPTLTPGAVVEQPRPLPLSAGSARICQQGALEGAWEAGTVEGQGPACPRPVRVHGHSLHPGGSWHQFPASGKKKKLAFPGPTILCPLRGVRDSRYLSLSMTGPFLQASGFQHPQLLPFVPLALGGSNCLRSSLALH